MIRISSILLFFALTSCKVMNFDGQKSKTNSSPGDLKVVATCKTYSNTERLIGCAEYYEKSSAREGKKYLEEQKNWYCKTEASNAAKQRREFIYGDFPCPFENRSSYHRQDNGADFYDMGLATYYDEVEFRFNGF